MRAVSRRVKKLVAKRLDDQLTESIRSVAAEQSVELEDPSVERLKGVIRWEFGTKPSAMDRIDRLAWVVVGNVDFVAPTRSSITFERRYRKVWAQLRGLETGLAEWARTTTPRKPNWERADTPRLDQMARYLAAWRGLPTTERQLSALRVELRDRLAADPTLRVLRDGCMREAECG